MQGICSRLTPSIPCLCSLSSWFWFIHGLFLHFGFGLLFVHSEPSFGFRILHFWNIGIKARLLLFESVSASLPSSAFLHLGPLVELNSDKYLLNMLVWMCLSYISRISCDFLYFQYACKDEAVPKEELYLWSLTFHHRTKGVGGGGVILTRPWGQGTEDGGHFDPRMRRLCVCVCVCVSVMRVTLL